MVVVVLRRESVGERRVAAGVASSALPAPCLSHATAQRAQIRLTLFDSRSSMPSRPFVMVWCCVIASMGERGEG